MTMTKLHIASDLREAHALHGKLSLSALVGANQGGYRQRSDQIEVVPGTNVTVDGQPLAEIWADLNARVQAYNASVDVWMSLFTFPTTRESERVAVYSTAGFEQATEFGKPSKLTMSYRRRYFPLDHFDLGIGYTQEYIDDAPSQEITALLGMVQGAYEAKRLAVVLEALLNNAPGADRDGVTPKPLFNADGEVPEQYKRTTHDNTHTHYLTSGSNGSFDGVDLDAMETHLLHHGYGDFGETLVLMVPRANIATARALTGYIHASESPRPVVREGAVVGQINSAPAGLRPDGYIGRWVVVESLDLPDNYLLGFATGGSFASTNPIGLRLHKNPSARGLRLVAGPKQDYPLVDSYYDTYLGAGVRHRGAAAVMHLTAGAYAAPTI
jgi:hypothetical protein